MKIAKLCLKRYGPFTDKQLVLNTNGASLNLIYGPNEAGKSSSLRALIALLFGIPQRTGDDHLHNYSSLLVGAQLIDQAGHSYEVYRRKTRSATLIDAQGNEVDEQIVPKMLGNLTEAQFRMFFGFDHPKLVEGGQQLEQQGGEVGQSLFAAGSGVNRLASVLDSLQAQADGLFKKTARQPKVNAALLLYKEHQDKMGQAMLKAQDWIDLQEKLAAVKQQYDALNQEIRTLRQQKERCQRVRQVAPLVAERVRLMEKLSHLENVRVLPEGMRQEYRESLEKRDTCRRLEALHQTAINDAKQALAALPVLVDLMDHDTAIEAACKRQALYESKVQEVPELKAQVRNLEQEIQHLLGRIGPGWGLDEIDKASLVISAADCIQALIMQEQSFKLRRQSLDVQLQQAKQGQDAEQHELAGLPAPGDLSGLQAAYDVAIKQVALDATLSAEQAKFDAMHRQVTNSVSRLAGFSGKADDLEALQVPSLETIKRFEAKITDIDHTLQRLSDQLNEMRREESRLDDQLRRLTLAGSMPTEADLLHSREQRNQAWRQVRKGIEGKEPVEYIRPYADAFEGLLFETDTVSDRLRRDAHHIAELASLNAEKEKLVAAQEKLTQDIAAEAQQKGQLLAEWLQVWAPSGVTPHSPAEMRDWHAQYCAALTQCAQLREMHSGLATIASELQRLGKVLLAQLGDVGGLVTNVSLEQLCLRAKRLLDDGANNNLRRAQLTDSIAKAQRQLEALRAGEQRLDAEVQAWAQEWSVAATGLGVDAAISTSAMQEVLGAFQSIESRRVLLAQVRAQLDAAQEVIADFEKETRALIGTLAPGDAGVPLLSGLAALKHALDKARQDQAQAQLLEQTVKENQVKLQGITVERAQAESRQQSLMQQAGCANEEAMDAALNGSDHKRQALADLADIEKQICHVGGGFALDALVAEVAAADLETVVYDLDEVTKTLDARETDKNALNQEIGRLQSDERHLSSSQGVGDVAVKAEAALAEVREHAQSYMLAKLSHILLKQAVEEYRKKSQASILIRAGEIFKALTLGGFVEIATEENGAGEMVLVGVRANHGKAVHVEGMSDGTRDQMFLALRLASLEHQLQAGEPLPLVIDDILVNFDDARSAAALKILAELSQKTQVLFFTHHERLLDLAQQHLAPATFAAHRLDQLPALA